MDIVKIAVNGDIEAAVEKDSHWQPIFLIIYHFNVFYRQQEHINTKL